ncbi:MAG TPA: DedA family protein [Frankiaceae bacterium]|nr:DedA family protein [Frankiaceae bacterium]
MHLPSWIEPAHLISTYGTIGLIVVIFAETGLLIGFFLPGDSLLVLAGAYSATKAGTGEPHLNLVTVLIGVAIAAMVGAQTGYAIGRFGGPRLFDRPRSRVFNPKNVDKAHEVLQHYGEGKAIVLARFIPIVRTFMNPVCGAARVPVRTFTLWKVVGGLTWSIGVTLIGFVVGKSIKIDKYVIPGTIVIVLLSVIPIALEARKSKQRKVAAEAASTVR